MSGTSNLQIFDIVNFACPYSMIEDLVVTPKYVVMWVQFSHHKHVWQ